MSRTPQPADVGPQPSSTDRTTPDVAALYQRHHGHLRRHAEQHLPVHLRHEAGAALSTVFMRLLTQERDGRLAAQDNWPAYLQTAVTNACTDIIRATRAHLEIDDDDALVHRDTPADPTGDSVADQVDQTRTASRVRAAVNRLPERERRIVIGVVVDRRTNKHIGEELGITGQRVGQLFRTALATLAEEVQDCHD